MRQQHIVRPKRTDHDSPSSFRIIVTPTDHVGKLLSGRSARRLAQSTIGGEGELLGRRMLQQGHTLEEIDHWWRTRSA